MCVYLRGSYSPPSPPLSFLHTRYHPLPYIPTRKEAGNKRASGKGKRQRGRVFPRTDSIQEWRVGVEKGIQTCACWHSVAGEEERVCAREAGEGVERWPREMRQTQTSRLPRPSPVSHRAQGKLWRPAPFNFLVLSDPSPQTHCRASRLGPSCGLSTLRRAPRKRHRRRDQRSAGNRTSTPR